MIIISERRQPCSAPPECSSAQGGDKGDMARLITLDRATPIFMHGASEHFAKINLFISFTMD